MGREVTRITRRDCLLALPLASAACARRPPSILKLLAMPYFNMAPLYLANESGYFADEGLRLEIQGVDRSQVAIPLLAAGQADVAFFGINPSMINAVLRGARIRLVAGRQVFSAQCPDERRLYGSRKAFPDGFTDFRQIKGKKASLGRKSVGIGGFLWTQCLAAAGLTATDVPLTDVNDMELSAAMLATGQIDVLLPTQEYDIGLTPLRDRIVPGPAISSILPGFMFSHIFFGKRLLDDSRDLGVRLLRAYFRGAREFVAGRSPRFVGQLIQDQHLDPKQVQLRQLCRAGYVLDGHIQMEDLQKFIDWSVDQKLTPVPVQAGQLVDPGFAGGIRGV